MSEAITAGHARALLPIIQVDEQKKAAEIVQTKELSVRETEKLVKRWMNPRVKPSKSVSEAYVLSVKDVENRLTTTLGTKVKLKDRQGKGSIVIEYYSNDDLDRILERIGVR
jgi:ParB family chromosome partitioning protein